MERVARGLSRRQGRLAVPRRGRERDPFAAGEDASASLDAGAALLKRHGAMVVTKQVEPGHGQGSTLLEAAEAEGADLLVMGAYGHSRLREIVLGGATREVLRGARLPVLLSC